MASIFEFGDWIFLLTSIFEMLIFCGFQTGWSSLVYVLVEEGIYSHLCIEDSFVAGNVTFSPTAGNVTLNNCPAQQEMLNLAYTLATSISAMAAFPIGIAVDSVGPRLVRIICGIMMGLACLLLSFMNKDNPELLFVGLIVVCICGLTLSMTPQTCVNRFKKGRSIFLGMYCGAWVSSSLTLLVFKIFYEQGGVRFAHFFRFLAVSCVFLCVNAALLYPNKVTFNTKQYCTKEKLKNIFKNKTPKTLTQLRETLGKSCKSCLGNKDADCLGTKETCYMKQEKCQLLYEKKHNYLNTSDKHSDLQLSENYINKDNVSMNTSLNISRNSQTSIAIPAANTNINCLKTALSHTSVCEGTFNEDEEPSMEVKPCRSPDVQVWTAISAESYLRSGLSYKNCALSTVHILGELFLVACKLRLWFYVGTFSNHIEEISGGDRQTVAKYVNLFGISQLAAFLYGPIFGFIVDRQSRQSNRESVSPTKDTEKNHHKFMMGIEDTTKAVDFIIQCNKEKIFKLNDAILMTACSAILFSLLTLIPSLPVQMVTFQFYTFIRVAYNALFASVLIIIFPPNHLGKLMGLAALLGAIFSLVQYPLFIIMEECFGGRLLEVNIILWLLCMLTFGLPIYLWRKATSHDPHCLTMVAV